MSGAKQCYWMDDERHRHVQLWMYSWLAEVRGALDRHKVLFARPASEWTDEDWREENRLRSELKAHQAEWLRRKRFINRAIVGLKREQQRLPDDE